MKSSVYYINFSVLHNMHFRAPYSIYNNELVTNNSSDLPNWFNSDHYQIYLTKIIPKQPPEVFCLKESSDKICREPTTEKYFRKL